MESVLEELRARVDQLAVRVQQHEPGERNAIENQLLALQTQAQV